MAATIYDIAKKAKVGIGTVSRVFNNHPSVSPETKERVLQVATRLNYHPHPYARGLARKRTSSMLAMIPFFSTFFFVEVLRGVQEKLSEIEYDLILCGVNQPDHVESTLRRNSFRNRVDGMLFFSMRMPEDFAGEFLRSKVPVVLVDTHYKNFDSFYVENIEGAYIATMHLFSLGHKRIAILNANPESPPARERLEGFQKAMKEAGLPVPPEYIRQTSSRKLDGFTRECGYELMREFIALQANMPTAIFVSSDIQAAGALAAIEEAGLRCPEDVAIVGFDDIEVASHLGITTMRQPMFDMGMLATARLMDRMSNENMPPKETTFVPTLIVRKTCGARTHIHKPADLVQS